MRQMRDDLRGRRLGGQAGLDESCALAFGSDTTLHRELRPRIDI